MRLGGSWRRPATEEKGHYEPEPLPPSGCVIQDAAVAEGDDQVLEPAARWMSRHLCIVRPARELEATRLRRAVGAADRETELATTSTLVSGKSPRGTFDMLAFA